MIKMAVLFILMFSLILSRGTCQTSGVTAYDFCVADYTAPSGPAGFSCKRPENVTVEDFVYSGLGIPGNSSNMFRGSITRASRNQVPSLNGFGLSMARIDLLPGGVVPVHTHPGANEILLLVRGKLIAGFISSDMNTLYMTTIKSGDMFMIPDSLFHFFVNIGGPKYNPVLAFASYSTSNLRIQGVDNALFGSSFPTDLINRTTFLSTSEIRRLKAVFGGTN